jgi:hypothetical protein
MLRWAGYGRKGDTGAAPSLAIGTVTTLAPGASATASITGTNPNYTVNFGIPQGTVGSSATATPLATIAASDLGVAAIGSSPRAAREDHVHNLPSGRLTLLGNVTVTETLLVSLAVGMKRMNLALSGVTTGDRLLAIPNGAPTSGCEVVNAYPATANNVSIGYYTPLLGIGTTYTIPVSVYRIS